MWQLQVRLKNIGTQWEPISVEPIRQIGLGYRQCFERRFHYESIEECQNAFLQFVGIEGSFPNLIVRQVTGRPKLTDLYDVRAIWTGEPGMILDEAALQKRYEALIAPAPSSQDQPTKKCLCNPYAEHSTETAPNCPIHGIRARGGVYESTKTKKDS